MGVRQSSPKLRNPVTVRCCWCERDRVIESSCHPKCPDCKREIAVRRNCERCPAEYLSLQSEYQNHSEDLSLLLRCKECRKYRKCGICGVETTKKVCDDCFQLRPRCACCLAKFEERFFLLYGEHYCGTCAERVRVIVGDKAVLPQRVEVTYEKRIIQHGKAFCRDVEIDDYTEEIKKFRRVYPVVDEEINLQRYERSPRTCSRYCHAGIFYRILSARLI